MAVTAADMKFYLSGGSSNSDPAASLGGEISTSEITSDVLNNLFDNVTPAQLADGSIDYRCFYIKNTNATDAIADLAVWIETQTTSADTVIDIQLDPAGISDGTSPSAIVLSPNEEDTDPGVDFAPSPSPVDYDTGLNIGTLNAGECIAVWVRRTVSAGGTAGSDTCTLKIQGSPS